MNYQKLAKIKLKGLKILLSRVMINKTNKYDLKETMNINDLIQFISVWSYEMQNEILTQLLEHKNYCAINENRIINIIIMRTKPLIET